MLCALSVALASLAPSRSARADPERGVLASLDLSWDVPIQCPARETILERLSLVLGDVRPTEKVVARARIRRDSSGVFVLSLGIRSGELDDERTIRDPSCDVVAAAAVVMLGLAIDPARALQDDPFGPSGSAPAEPESATSDANERAPAARLPPTVRRPAKPPAAELGHARKRRLAFGLSIGPSADFGTLGRPRMGALARVHLAFIERFRADLGLVASMPVDLTLESNPALGIQVRTASAVARGCFLPVEHGGTQLGACAGIELATAYAEGFGTRERRSDEAMWLALGAGVLGRVRLTSTVHFAGSVYGTLPREAPRWGLEIGGEALLIQRVSPGVRVTLGVELAVF